MIGTLSNAGNLRPSPTHEATCPLTQVVAYEKKGDTGKENECLPKKRMNLLCGDEESGAKSFCTREWIVQMKNRVQRFQL